MLSQLICQIYVPSTIIDIIHAGSKEDQRVILKMIVHFPLWKSFSFHFVYMVSSSIVQVRMYASRRTDIYLQQSHFIRRYVVGNQSKAQRIYQTRILDNI